MELGAIISTVGMEEVCLGGLDRSNKGLRKFG